MKYIYWLFVLLIVIYRRIAMPLVFIAIPLRGYARNVIYNYHVRVNKPLKRLWERRLLISDKDIHIHSKHGFSVNGVLTYPVGGKIHKRYVSCVEYWLVLFLIWGYLDDDANQDTFDKGFNQTIINGLRKKWMPRFIINEMISINAYADRLEQSGIIGNSFDLGDKRSKYPLYEFWSVLMWSLRNPSYNFNYRFNQMVGDEYAFKIIIKGRLFGWKEDGSIKDRKNNTIPCYSWECGKKI